MSHAGGLQTGVPFQFNYLRPPDRRSVFESTLLHADERLLVLSHDLTPSHPLVIDGVTVLDSGYRALWFLYKDEAWDLAKVFRPNGQFTGYYVDALMPLHWVDADPWSLEPLTDLFLDLWVGLDGNTQVLDEDELLVAEEREWVSHDQATLARSTIARLQHQTVAFHFPPDEITQWAA